MRKLMTAWLVAMAGLTNAAPGPKDREALDDSLVGEWVGLSALRDGTEKPAPPGGVTYTFAADGRYATREGRTGKTDTGTYTTNRAKKPAHLDLTSAADTKDPRALFIYKVDGDTLTLCYTKGGPDVPRPEKFDAPEGSKTIVLTFKRGKAK